MRKAFGVGDVMTLVTVLLWASSFSIVKSAYAEFTPLAFAAVRFVGASLGMLALLLALRRPLGVRRADLPRAALVGLFHVALYQIFFSTGLRYTTASNSVLIIAISPVLTALLVWATRAEPISGRQWVGILLALVGVFLLVQAGGAVTAGHLRGDLLTLLAAASYAVTPVVILPLLRRYPTISVMMVGMLFGTLVLIAAGVPELRRQSWDLTPTAWGQLAYAAFGAGTVAYLLWYEGIARIGPTRVAAYSYLIPVLGVAIAVVTLREAFTGRHLLGAGVAMAGVALTRWPGRSGEAAAAPSRPLAATPNAEGGS